MALSLTESAARVSIIRFLKGFIFAGNLTLQEEDGNVLSFEGSLNMCPYSVSLRIHNPQFYWKLAIEADLGLANAFIQGDFSCVDEDEGLLNLLMILIANKYSLSSATRINKNWDWWTPLFSVTARIASAKYIYRLLSRRNTLTQARRNISRHYDMSNELFSLFMDETMMYSCAIFKSEEEDLEVAQRRKISLLIEKARIEKYHEVLEIGCGWGGFGIEVVKRTGCNYTGITISEEQLKFAQEKAKKAGLEDRIRFLFCDYRQLKDVKFDRIISCEMLESVGHEYIEEYFRCCESLLATNGLFVLQFISVADEFYDEFRKIPGFGKEHIFAGGCLPSLSRVTSAMASASRLCVEHVENIGDHYYTTIRCWRKNFLENQSKILSLGFDEKFIRTWEYYFDYSAAGFKMRTLGDYQVVFSRQGNTVTFNDPYARIPSAHCCP